MMNPVVMMKSALAVGIVIVSLLPAAEAQQAASFDALLDKAATYDEGQDRAGLLEIEQTVRSALAGQDLARLASMEKAISARLGKDRSAAFRLFLCKQLSLIGTEASIPVLMPMVKDPATSDMARYALERIPGKTVDLQLREALADARGLVQIGIIMTLGVRGDEGSVPALAGLVTDPNVRIGQAAVSALARIGTATAASALAQARDRVSGPLQARILDAELRCAGRLASVGKVTEAVAICKPIFEDRFDPRVRGAALRGWVTADRAQAGQVLLKVLEGPDTSVLVYALPLVAKLDDRASVEAAGRLLPKLAPGHQVLLIEALASAPFRVPCEVVTGTSASTEESVRLACLRFLARSGQASAVKPLAQAASLSKGSEQKEARAGLSLLSGQGVDEAMLALLGEAAGPVKVELIRALGDRKVVAASGPILDAAGSTDGAVSREALRALALVGQEKDLDAAIRLLTQAPGKEAQDAVVAIGLRAKDQGARAHGLIAAAKQAKTDQVRDSVFQVLARLGEDQALDLVRADLKGPDPKRRTAAVKALSQWTTATPMADLLEVAKADQDTTRQVLALRGYVGMVQSSTTLTGAQKADGLAKALGVARRPEEKKLAVGALGTCSSKEALDLAVRLTKDPEVKLEAQLAAVKLCQALAKTHAAEVEPILGQLAAEAANDEVRQQVQEATKALAPGKQKGKLEKKKRARAGTQ